MNQHMWGQTQTQNNTQQLSDTSVHIVGPDSGIQACGDVGSGRMTEPMAILDELESKLSKGPLARQHLVITAGPTHEPIDPVRYIANRSSGKMGFALAESANRLGARVTLISGPVHLDTPNGVKRIDINTASEMFEAVEHAISDATLFIGAAAVCDMRPVTIASQKLKKSNSDLSRIDLIENPDIIKAVATHSNRPALVVGFAAETDDMMEHAQQKLVSKSLDLIIANSVANGKIFGQDSTEATLIDANTTRQLLSGPKDDVATQILIEISKLLPERI
jgi:phosphopantothenoylcysteine decarboxylase/phosphopantothenate--cysteine ligase